MNTFFKNQTPQLCASRGLTIVELLVAVTISSIMIAVASAVYLNSSKSYRALDEVGRTDEAGRLALKIITSNLQQAGFQLLDGPRPGNPYAKPPGKVKAALRGCRYGYTKAANSNADWTCKANGNANDSDSFAVLYDVDFVNPTGGTNGEGTDCVGARANAADVRQAWNHFYVATDTFTVGGQERTVSQLMCAGRNKNNEAASPAGGVQPILAGVQQLTLTYGKAAPGKDTPTEFVDASALLTEDDWDLVTAVRVCILMKSELTNTVLNTGGAVTDCRGNAVDNTGQFIYKTMTSTIALRNRVSSSLDPNT
jgi:type IV pilus assembly protein PilW